MTKEVKRRLLIVFLLIFLILLADQVSKIWVKTNMTLGDEFIVIPNWFRITFVENDGSAFGMKLFSNKMYLTILRILLAIAIGYYLFQTIRKNFKFGFSVGIALIFAGALGNIIDCIFYGVLFSSSVGQVATFLPEGGGYAPLFYGQVVDMLHFPLFHATWPSWLPWVGGESFIFFSPVFNVADAAVSIGVFYILIFQNQYLKSSSEKKEEAKQE